MIKNEYRVTWKLYKSWLWENKRKPPKSGFTVMWVIFGMAVTGMAAVFRFAPYLIIAFLCFYRAFIRDILAAGRQYAAMEKSYGQKDWIRTIAIDEEQILLQEGNISVNYKYSDISGIKEKGNKVWLMLRDGKVIRMYKDCFVDSDWETCRNLLVQRCIDLEVISA